MGSEFRGSYKVPLFKGSYKGSVRAMGVVIGGVWGFLGVSGFRDFGV